MNLLLLAAAPLVVIVVAIVWRGGGGEAADSETAATEPGSAVPRDPEASEITSRYAELDGVSLDPDRIPEKLRHLLGLARVWAIGDDVERQRFLESVSMEEKKAFVDAVDPLQEELAAWSQERSSDTPVPDEVVLYDMMAEAAAEAVAEVYPQGKPPTLS